MAKEPYLEAGKIINTFGGRGEVKLDPWCDSAEFLKPLKTLYIDGAPRAVASSRVHKGMLIVRFADVEDVNGAMLLKNKIVYFARSDVRLPKGRHFVADLLGAAVVDEQGTEIGKLYVESCFQSQHIGQALIRFAINRGAELVWTLEKNTRAIAFYARHGFRPTGEKKFEEGTTEYLVELRR